MPVASKAQARKRLQEAASKVGQVVTFSTLARSGLTPIDRSKLNNIINDCIKLMAKLK